MSAVGYERAALGVFMDIDAACINGRQSPFSFHYRLVNLCPEKQHGHSEATFLAVSSFYHPTAEGRKKNQPIAKRKAVAGSLCLHFYKEELLSSHTPSSSIGEFYNKVASVKRRNAGGRIYWISTSGKNYLAV